MKIFNRKSKKSPKPPQQGTPSGTATDVTPGPPSLRADVDPEGEQNRSYHDFGDGPDPVMVLDGEDTKVPQIVIQDKNGEDREPPVSAVSTPQAVVDGAEHGNGPTSECFRSLPLGLTLCGSLCLPTDEFGTLKSVLGTAAAAYPNRKVRVRPPFRTLLPLTRL